MTDHIVAFDTETHRIGPGAVVPRMVCASFAWSMRSKVAGAPDHVESCLYAACEPECLEQLRRLLEPGNGTTILGHNLAYDLAVACKRFPELIPLVWEKLARRECVDTMHREQLINLATHGKLEKVRLPDGSTANILYSLEELAANYLGIDLSGVKKGADSWRLRYGELDGKPAREYPAEAFEYAREDAELTFQVYEAQQDRLQVIDHDLVGVDRFQATTAFPLQLVTDAGMPIDPEEYERLARRMAAELSDEKMRPLVDAGLLRASVPSLPYVRQEKKAREMVEEWTGILAEDVDFARLEPGLIQALQDAGIKFKEAVAASKNTAAIKTRVLRLLIEQQTLKAPTTTDLEELQKEAHALGVDYKLTDGGDVCTDGEVIDGLAPHDPVIHCLSEREALGKLVSTELPRMTWEGKVAEVVHFPYKTLVETGRTSSMASKLYPSANGQNVDPRARSCYVPRKGYLLSSTDYSTLELVCVGQTTLDLFGKSVHAEKINAGVDLHAYLGATIAWDLSPDFRELAPGGEDPDVRYRMLHSFKPDDHPHHQKHYKLWRKLAKPVGLGLPGGLGPQKLIEIARKDPYNVDIVKVAVDLFDQDPASFLVDRTVLYYAKRLHKMTEQTFRWTPALKGVALAARWKRLWLETYPEMKTYLAWVAEQTDGNNVLAAPTEDDPDREVDALCYVSPLGMLRRGASYTACANGKAMQTPAAEGFKHAVFAVARACWDTASTSVLRRHGCRLLNQIHDELIVEVPDDLEASNECAREVQRLMVEGMRAVIRDVKVKAEPCLMRRWRKEAQPVFDSQGRLVPWEPKVKAV